MIKDPQQQPKYLIDERSAKNQQEDSRSKERTRGMNNVIGQSKTPTIQHKSMQQKPSPIGNFSQAPTSLY